MFPGTWLMTISIPWVTLENFLKRRHLWISDPRNFAFQKITCSCGDEKALDSQTMEYETIATLKKKGNNTSKNKQIQVVIKV